MSKKQLNCSSVKVPQREPMVTGLDSPISYTRVIGCGSQVEKLQSFKIGKANNQATSMEKNTSHTCTLIMSGMIVPTRGVIQIKFRFVITSFMPFANIIYNMIEL